MFSLLFLTFLDETILGLFSSNGHGLFFKSVILSYLLLNLFLNNYGLVALDKESASIVNGERAADLFILHFKDIHEFIIELI